MSADPRHDQLTKWGLDGHALLHLKCLLSVHPELVITSGHRSPRHNAEVGGSKTSWHLVGRAVDLYHPVGRLLGTVMRTAEAQRVTHGCTGPEEVLWEKRGKPGEHLHLAW